MERVFRIQDADGRGPWKPGFSEKWVRQEPDTSLLPWFFEIGPVHKKALFGEHVGCGCRTIEQLKLWFTEPEYRKLLRFGYKAVKMSIGRVLGESKIQCVFGCHQPLKEIGEEIELYPHLLERNEE